MDKDSVCDVFIDNLITAFTFTVLDSDDLLIIGS